MKRAHNKSHCPVNYALETFGDSWSLLIIRDIVYFGKTTFREFLSSEEAISTNILANRLHYLEQRGILTKVPHASDKRREIYGLTPKGLDLIPVLLEMSGWSAHHDSDTTAPVNFVECVYADREGMFKLIRETVQAGGAIFTGPNNVVSKMVTLNLL